MAQPKEPHAGLEEAELLLGAKRFRAACTGFAKCVEMDGHRAQAYRGWGRALARLGNHVEAAARFEAAIAADATDEATYESLGEIWSELPEADRLLSRIQRQVDSFASADAHTVLANFLVSRGKTVLAISEYEKVAEQIRGDARSLLRWGAALATGLPRHEEALEQYEIALESLPQASESEEGRLTEDLFALVAASLSELGVPENRVARIQQIIDRVNNPRTRVHWARTLYDLNRAPAGDTQFALVSAAQPDRWATWLSWGDALSAIDKHEEAILKYEKAIELNPAAPDAYLGVYKPLSTLANVDVAVSKIQTIVAKTQSAVAHGHWAKLLSRLEKRAMALDEFEAAFRGSPDDVSYIDWAMTLRASGRDAEAASKALAGIARHPRRSSERRLRYLLTSTLKTSSAVETLQSNLELEIETIGTSEVYIFWGDILASLGKSEASLEAYERAALKSPDNTGLALKLGNLLAQRGRHKEALARFAAAIEKECCDKRVFNAFCASLLQVDAETRKSFIEAVQANVDRGQDFNSHLHWGKTLTKLGDHTGAVAQHEATVRLSPQDPDLQVTLGVALATSKRFARAVRCYVRAVSLSSGEEGPLVAALEAFKSAFAQLDSDDPIAALDEAIHTIDGATAYREWGLVLGSLGRASAELVQFERAVEKAPTRSDVRAEYAFKLVFAGQIDKGLSEHRLAAERQPEDAFVHGAWGFSLSRLRLFQKAVEKYECAAELPGGEHFLFNWALALDGMGSHESAVKKYRDCIQALAGPVNSAYCLHNIADIRTRQGNYRDAAKAWDTALLTYEQAIPQGRNDAEFLLYYGSVWQNIKQDFESAMKQYAKALELQPKNTQVLGAIATLNRKRLEFLSHSERKSERAIECHWAAREAYLKARTILTHLHTDLATTPSLIEMGTLHLAMSEGEEAKTCFIKALAIDKDSAEASALLGKAYLQTQEYKNALNFAGAAVARDSQNLDYRSTLAEAHQKLSQFDTAEIEFGKILAVAPCHIDALIGLANTYLAQADELHKSSKPTEAEDMFSRALETFAHATSAAQTAVGSRRLSPFERAALSYSCGYANVMRYETQTLAKRDGKLLEAALRAFDEVPLVDPNYHKAQRARLKIKERTQIAERSARSGAWIIVISAFVIFLITNFTFLLGKPGFATAFQITDQSLLVLKAAQVPVDAVDKLEALSKGTALTKAAFDAKLKSVLGDDVTAKYGDIIRGQAATEPAFQWHESLETGYYALLSFGALMFMVAGLYLQQLSKLKFGGFELEKTTEAATNVVGSLGVTK
jgi:tetratricopeptide (TPR) repeat protein